jgi:hypothetical protein
MSCWSLIAAEKPKLVTLVAVAAADHNPQRYPTRSTPTPANPCFVADQLRGRWPELAALMDDSEHDVLAYMIFPGQHRTKLRSTNPLERLNKEVKRRTT